MKNLILLSYWKGEEMKRNLTLEEKKCVAASMPKLVLNNWLMFKKYPDHFVLRHKFTGSKKKVPVV
jgi:hypothetical protein